MTYFRGTSPVHFSQAIRKFMQHDSLTSFHPFDYSDIIWRHDVGSPHDLRHTEQMRSPGANISQGAKSLTWFGTSAWKCSFENKPHRKPKILSKAVLSLASLAALVSASCKPLPQGQSIGKTSNVTIESSGIPRSYLISIPPAYDCETPIPVILSFHGANRNASQQQKLSQMSNPEFNNFAFAIYPLGLDVLILPK